MTLLLEHLYSCHILWFCAYENIENVNILRCVCIDILWLYSGHMQMRSLVPNQIIGCDGSMKKWKAGAKKSHYFCCLRSLKELCNNWMAFRMLFSGGSVADKLPRKNNNPSSDWQNEKKKFICHSQTTTHSEPKAMTQLQWLKFMSTLQIMSFLGSVWTLWTKPIVCHWEVCGGCSKQLVSSHNDHQKGNTSLPWGCGGCNLWIFLLDAGHSHSLSMLPFWMFYNVSSSEVCN